MSDELSNTDMLDHACYRERDILTAGIAALNEPVPGEAAPDRSDLEHAIGLVACRVLGLNPNGVEAIRFRRELHACVGEFLADGLTLGGELSGEEEEIVREETKRGLLALVCGTPPSLPRRPGKSAPPWELKEWRAARTQALAEHFRLAFLRFCGLVKGFAPELLAHASLEEIGDQFGGLTRQDVCYHTGKIPGVKGSRGKGKLGFQKQPATVEKCRQSQKGNSSRLSGMCPPARPPKAVKPRRAS